MHPRRLILMRHGEAADPLDPGGDRARALTQFGRAQARGVGRDLQRLGWTPAQVHSSDSQRTRGTWREAACTIENPPEAHFWSDLYLGGLKELREQARCWDGAATTLLALGHNPGWSVAASELSGVRIALHTACAALLQGSGGSWTEALHGRWELVDVLRPTGDR